MEWLRSLVLAKCNEKLSERATVMSPGYISVWMLDLDLDKDNEIHRKLFDELIERLRAAPDNLRIEVGANNSMWVYFTPK